MRRFLLGLVFILALLVGGAWAYGRSVIPERDVMNDAARSGAQGSFVHLADGVTHYDVAGPDTGRVVVLVHGFSVPYYIWDSTSVGLSAMGYRVVRYDLLGRGLSDRPHIQYDGALYERQLNGLLDSLHIQGPVDLVGLSFGGFVTGYFAGHDPKRVRTLTLVDPMSEGIPAAAILKIPVLGFWYWQVTREPGMADGQMTDFLHPERYPDWVERYRPQMTYEGFGWALFSSMMNTANTDFGALYAAVAKAGIPVALFWGRQDRTIPFERSEVVRTAIPEVRFIPVDSAGHVSHIEQAAFVNARLSEFLQAHPGG